VENLKVEREKLQSAENNPEASQEVDEAKEILLNLGVDLCSHSVQLSCIFFFLSISFWFFLLPFFFFSPCLIFIFSLSTLYHSLSLSLHYITLSLYYITLPLLQLKVLEKKS